MDRRNPVTVERATDRRERRHDGGVDRVERGANELLADAQQQLGEIGPSTLSFQPIAHPLLSAIAARR